MMVFALVVAALMPGKLRATSDVHYVIEDYSIEQYFQEFGLIVLDTYIAAAHCHSDFLVKNLGGSANCGVNEIYTSENALSYAEHFIPQPNASLTASCDDKLYIGAEYKVTPLGGQYDIQDGEGNVYRMDRPSPANVYTDADIEADTSNIYKKYADMDSIARKMIAYNQAIAAYADSKPDTAVKEFQDWNNRTVISGHGECYTVMPPSDLQGTTPMYFNFEELNNPENKDILVINVDLKGQPDFYIGSDLILRSDSGSIGNAEANITKPYNRMIFNFYDSSREDLQYVGNISTNKRGFGTIIAPSANVNLAQNWDGIVVANNLTTSAQYHKVPIVAAPLVEGQIISTRKPQSGDNDIPKASELATSSKEPIETEQPKASAPSGGGEEQGGTEYKSEQPKASASSVGKSEEPKASAPVGGGEEQGSTGDRSEGPKATTPSGYRSEGPKASTPSGNRSEQPKASTSSVGRSEEPKASTPSIDRSEGPKVSASVGGGEEQGSTGDRSEGPKATTPSGYRSEGPKASTPSGNRSEEPKATTPSGDRSEEPKVSTSSVDRSEGPKASASVGGGEEQGGTVDKSEGPKASTPSGAGNGQGSTGSNSEKPRASASVQVSRKPGSNTDDSQGKDNIRPTDRIGTRNTVAPQSSATVLRQSEKPVNVGTNPPQAVGVILPKPPGAELLTESGKPATIQQNDTERTKVSQNDSELLVSSTSSDEQSKTGSSNMTKIAGAESGKVDTGDKAPTVTLIVMALAATCIAVCLKLGKRHA